MSLLTVAEAAAYLKLSKRSLERLRVSGFGPWFIKTTKRSVRYRQSDLDEWIASRCHVSTSAATEQCKEMGWA